MRTRYLVKKDDYVEIEVGMINNKASSVLWHVMWGGANARIN